MKSLEVNESMEASRSNCHVQETEDGGAEPWSDNWGVISPPQVSPREKR